jgi:hypothetical protein
MPSADRFFGGNPIWVIVRLALLSVIVGVILVGLGLTPYELVNGAMRFIRQLWHMGFDAIEQLGEYFLIGAVIVVPIWIIMRLLSMGRRG